MLYQEFIGKNKPYSLERHLIAKVEAEADRISKNQEQVRKFKRKLAIADGQQEYKYALDRLVEHLRDSKVIQRNLEIYEKQLQEIWNGDKDD